MPGTVTALGLADAEHLGPASGTRSLSGWPTVFHGDLLGVLYISRRSTLDAVGLHGHLQPKEWLHTTSHNLISHHNYL